MQLITWRWFTYYIQPTNLCHSLLSYWYLIWIICIKSLFEYWQKNKANIKLHNFIKHRLHKKYETSNRNQKLSYNFILYHRTHLLKKLIIDRERFSRSEPKNKNNLMSSFHKKIIRSLSIICCARFIELWYNFCINVPTTCVHFSKIFNSFQTFQTLFFQIVFVWFVFWYCYLI